MIEIERTDFLGVYTRDLERSARFYGETLGLRRNRLAHSDWPEFETGNLTLHRSYAPYRDGTKP